MVICNDGDYFLRHRLFVVSRLVSLGHDVTVLAGGDPIHAQLAQGWQYNHIRIEHLSFSPFGDLALTWRSLRTILDLKPDAIHLITLKPAVFSGIASAISCTIFGYPQTILITLPGLGRMLTYSKGPGERHYPVATALTLGALRLIAKSGSVQFSFETRHDFEFFERHGIVNTKNSTVINGAGVDPSEFHPTHSAVVRVRKRILFAGRLMKSKGLGIFLAAARELSDRKDVEFLVAGKSDDKDPDALRAEDLAQSDCIHFLGHVEDMPALLRSCDIVCLPTRYGEGIPRILIEAAATSLASIASSHPGCLEVITDGTTGQILHGRSDAELTRQLSAAIVRYLDIPKLLDRHKHAAYQHFRSRSFSEEAICAQFCELLGADKPA